MAKRSVNELFFFFAAAEGSICLVWMAIIGGSPDL
jgi:hypothetical protein